jgi:glycine/D-amino acid oxidase-like deaminating enzyme
MRRSFWLEELGNELAPREPLNRSVNADVAIIGGGFVGLWTALELVEKSPGIRVVILEKDICGSGASGRNGGFVMSWWPKFSSLVACCGQDEAVRLAAASVRAIGEVGQFCREHDINAHFRQNGWLWTATTAAQMDAWQAVANTCTKLGYPVFEHLSADELCRRSGSEVHLGGVFDPSVATVQPARLAWGLRRIALQKGIKIFEKTPVTAFDRQKPVHLTTPAGRVVADRVVIASNVWASAIPELSRVIVPVTSTVVITEPIPDRLAEIGWIGGEAITDSQLFVDYYRTTLDGRIAFGKGTGALAFGSRIGARFQYSEEDAVATEADFRRVYPQLRDVRVAHSWSGGIDRTYDSLPVLGALPEAQHIVYGVGWSGNGVGPSRIGGRILSSLALGIKDEWSQAGLVNRKTRLFPPEPLRFVGGNLVRHAVLRKERAEALGRKPSRLDVSFARLAPAGLEDKAR